MILRLTNILFSFRVQETTTIILGYTPAASRSGFHERDCKNISNQIVNGTLAEAPRSRSTGDVEFRSRPIEYSAVVETFFACAGYSAMAAVLDNPVGAPPVSSSVMVGDKSNAAFVMSDIAAYVAAGGILPPGGVAAAAEKVASSHRHNTSRRPVGNVGGSSKNIVGAFGSKSFAPCPPIEPERLLAAWNPLATLVRSMLYHAAGCCETKYVELGGPFQTLSQFGESKNREAAHSPMECIDAIHSIAKSSPAGVSEEVFDAHLLQLLGVATSLITETDAPSFGSVLESEQRLNERLFDILVNVVSAFILGFLVVPRQVSYIGISPSYFICF